MARSDRGGWHLDKGAAGLTLSRRVPVRFDLAVETVLPRVHALRLAHQLRQDVWRALRRQRGFAPAVRIVPDGVALRVTAGGQVDGPFPRARAEAALRAVLDCPANRARWCRFAGGGNHA